MMLLCGWLLACTQLAYGHAALVSSEPAEGTILAAAPSTVSLTFNEPVGPLAFKLITPDGRTLQPGPAESLNDDVRITLPPSSTQGSYLLSWRVVSADGHPVGGVVSYAVGAASADSSAGATGTAVLRDAAIWATRLLLYLCLIASTGAALWRASSPKSPRQDWVRRVIPVGLALLVLSLGLQGLDALDVPWQGLGQADTWRAAFDTRYAGTLGFAAMSLAAAYRTLDSHRLWVQRIAATASALLLGVALANSGHASTAAPQWLSQPAVAVHIITVAAWIGALIPLIRLLRANTDALPATLSRFSHWIAPVVGLLLLSGATLVWLQLDTVSDLWRTPYGRILSVKLSLIVLLFMLAAANRYRYTRPVLAGDAQARQGLLRLIKLEIVLAVCILGVVSLWRFTPPPRSLHAAAQLAHTGHGVHSATVPGTLPPRFVLNGTQVHAALSYQSLSPSQPGTLSIILIRDQTGSSMSAQAVTVTLSNPEADIEALRRDATQTAQGGAWQATIPPLPRTGNWEVRLDIRVDDFAQITLEGPIT